MLGQRPSSHEREENWWKQSPDEQAHRFVRQSRSVQTKTTATCFCSDSLRIDSGDSLTPSSSQNRSRCRLPGGTTPQATERRCNLDQHSRCARGFARRWKVFCPPTRAACSSVGWSQSALRRKSCRQAGRTLRPPTHHRRDAYATAI